MVVLFILLNVSFKFLKYASAKFAIFLCFKASLFISDISYFFIIFINLSIIIIIAKESAIFPYFTFLFLIISSAN